MSHECLHLGVLRTKEAHFRRHGRWMYAFLRRWMPQISCRASHVARVLKGALRRVLWLWVYLGCACIVAWHSRVDVLRVTRSDFPIKWLSKKVCGRMGWNENGGSRAAAQLGQPSLIPDKFRPETAGVLSFVFLTRVPNTCILAPIAHCLSRRVPARPCGLAIWPMTQTLSSDHKRARLPALSGETSRVIDAATRAEDGVVACVVRAGW